MNTSLTNPNNNMPPTLPQEPAGRDAVRPPAKRTTTISLDGNLLQVAKAKAREERRTLSAQLEIWIEEKLRAAAGAAAAASAAAVSPNQLS